VGSGQKRGKKKVYFKLAPNEYGEKTICLSPPEELSMWFLGKGLMGSAKPEKREDCGKRKKG